jgi:DNA-binding NtrC family response regulator
MGEHERLALPRQSRAPSAESALPPVDIDRPFIDGKAEVLATFERPYLGSILDKHTGNISRAAAAAGLDRMYFKGLLKKYRG